MKEPGKTRRFLRLLLAAVLLGAIHLTAVRVAAWWPLPPRQAWAATLLALLGLWVLWRAFGFDAPARRRRRLLRHRLRDLDSLSGAAFEDWVAAVLRAAGFEVELTPRTGDYGVDLIATHNGRRIGIEAKRRGRPISNHVVRSVVAGCQYHACDRAAVVTQSRFTDNAVSQARAAAVDVVLVARDDLHRLPELLVR